jgi:hypothetical protein
MVGARVARFFLLHHTKTGKNSIDFKVYPMNKKYTQWTKSIPNVRKIYPMNKKYTQCQKNIPNRHIIYQNFQFKGPPKYTQIGIFLPSGNPDGRSLDS